MIITLLRDGLPILDDERFFSHPNDYFQANAGSAQQIYSEAIN